MRRTVTASVVVALALASSARAAVITQWNFNSNPADASTSTGTLTPSTGTGTASNVGGTTFTYATGSLTDPASAGNDNTGWNSTAWAAQGTGSGTRGVQLTAATTGYSDIVVTWDMRMSGTVSRFFQLQYTTDGSNYSNVSGGTAGGPANLNNNTAGSITNAGLISVTAASGSQQFAEGLSYTFPTGSAVENNANFGLRLVAVFDPVNGSNYISANAGTTAAYSANGTLRLDMFTISGTAVPEPGTLGLLIVGAFAAIRRRRA